MSSIGFVSACLGACKATAIDPLDAAPSPQANAEPAPLANVPATALNAVADAGPPPEPLRTDRPLEADAPRESSRERLEREVTLKDPARDPKELAGYSLQAILRTGEGAPALKGSEVNTVAIEAARRKTEVHMLIEASQTRARFVLSGGVVLPQGTELRSRVDRYGHLVLWPGEETYRVAQPGALRALFGERRLDVAPLSPANLTASGEGPARKLEGTLTASPQRGQHLNLRTRRVELSTRAAKATFEIAALRDAGEGGVLVCRMLLDLVNAPPSTRACVVDEMPVHAELRWTTQGMLAFDVTSIARRLDLVAQDLAAPPVSAAFAPGPPPAAAGEALLSKADLTSLRNAPVDVPPAMSRDAQESPPETGLLLVNSSDELRVAWIDGAAAAWVAPGGREWLSSLVRGRYVVQSRTFLGDAWGPPRTVVVPGTTDLSAP